MDVAKVVQVVITVEKARVMDVIKKERGIKSSSSSSRKRSGGKGG